MSPLSPVEMTSLYFTVFLFENHSQIPGQENTLYLSTEGNINVELVRSPSVSIILFFKMSAMYVCLQLLHWLVNVTTSPRGG